MKNLFALPLPCRARTGLQACTAQPADDMSSEFPASPPNPSPETGAGSFVRTCAAGNRIEEVA